MIFETQRLILRLVETGDAADIFEMVSDAQTCYDDGGYEPFRQMDDGFLAMVRSFAQQEGRLAIVLKDEEKTIGLIHLFKENDTPGGYELGYVLNKAYRRQKLAFEAVSAFLENCRKSPEIKSIKAGTYAWNEASMRLLEKLGFVKTGISQTQSRHCQRGMVHTVCFLLEKI